MALFKAFKKIVLSHQVKLLEAVQSNDVLTFFGQHTPVRWRRFSHSVDLAELGQSAKAETASLISTKRLKVAIVGRPNAGKSTLINRILKLNVCDVSPKSHTTRCALKTAFSEGDTQIVFMDTPGLVTKKELSRFELSDVFVKWKEKIFEEADIIGVIHEVTSPKDLFKLHLKLVEVIHGLPESKPLFIILNKVDLVLDKAGLSKAIDKVTSSTEEDGVNSKVPNIWSKFSKIFVVSAFKNIGVREMVDYLLEQAKPGSWHFEPRVVCNKPLHVLVTNLLRAQIMMILPKEVPYKCDYEVEYLEENSLGEIICVALVKCKIERHLKILVGTKKNALKKLSKKLESDLYKITGKCFRLRIVAICVNQKARSGVRRG